ncbi:MAG: hypothetical protein ACKVG0_11740 [Alphaproteobacteria bacterium]|jgi:uncharacterized membrane protein YjjB (DUF3815 family)
MKRARVIGLISTFASAFAVGLVGVWIAQEYQARSSILLVAAIFAIGVPVALLLGHFVRRALTPSKTGID